MKLAELSKEQVAKMSEVKQYWLNYIFSCKHSVDREKARIGIDWLYKSVGRAEPIVVFVDSPMACQYAVLYIKEFVKKFPQLFSRDQVGAQVRDQVRAQVWAQVWDQNFEFTSFGAYPNVGDYGWVSFFDFFTQIGVIDHDGFNRFRDILNWGVYDTVQLNGFCIISDMPRKLIRNNAGRLHNPTGPAVEFADGYKQYYVNGRALPAWIWEKAAAGEITRDMFLKEQNSEIKGGIYEVLGQKKMMELLGAKEVDTRKIFHANGDVETVTLLKTKQKFPEIDNQPFAWVKMVCPSTGSQYLQGVEPHHTNALEAIASLSPFKSEEYSFHMRS